LVEEFDVGEAPKEIIGRGTWIDKLALTVIDRKDSLKGKHPLIIRTESGLGASGFPHIGSFADASRAYAFKLALEDQGRESEFLAFADDMDGLRKVPAGTPPELEEHLGKPVSMIPDLWGCHESYGQHMASLLIDALNIAGIEFTPVSAHELYTTGKMAPPVIKLLTNAKLAGEIIKETTGSEKYIDQIPYHAICDQCGKIYTTKAINFDVEKGKVEYICEGEEIKGKMLKGCNHHGWSDISKGEGKLTWKVEFAARWDLQQIDFEAYGKDIFESVKCNDKICQEIFNYEPPSHARYEMFLDKGGTKISKSKGNVFTPQDWFKYGSSQSLALLTYKRMVGTRTLSVDDIPTYMKEIDYLEDLYFGRVKEKNQFRKKNLMGLFEYCWHLKPPQKPSNHIPYNLLVNVITVAPETAREDFIDSRLRLYGYLKEDTSLDEIADRVNFASNWVNDFKTLEETEIELSSEEKKAISMLIKTIESSTDADSIQTAIFETARANQIKPRDFFKILYQILLNSNRGPKLGPYISTMGVKNVIKSLERYIGA
jgi:lysyl-tRNA synthetase class 1